MFKFFKKTKSVNPTKIPQHIAFICDGNRRWAENRGLPPLMGHQAGIANFEKMAKWFIDRGVTTLTFFIFSTENWDRSEEEVNFLMNLFCDVMEKNKDYALKQNIRYRVIGSRDKLPKKLAKLCDELEEKSAENTGGTIVFALNYGGQDEIVRAANMAIENGEPVTRETFETFMDSGDLLPIDLMVRTSNECRISNFMLWKLAYAELLFIPEHWPDLVRSEKLWQHVLDEFATRNRRFGGGKKKDYSGKAKGK
ncbi:MAG: di-trans,poly-cis-decaprenylcistransferase [Alphaproteobacteria bacterium]|nr:di-trans,poly-cis-decaprenylcistransferase [Alphaproteobacteria bacterium]